MVYHLSRAQRIERRMNRRQGIVYSIQESGTARIIFNEDRTLFEGVLESECGEVISLQGKIRQGSTTDGKEVNGNTQLMEVFIVDGEAGCSFRVLRVPVLVDENEKEVFINHSAVNFHSTDRLIGMKADQEIQQFMKPKLVTDGKTEVYVGPMKLHVVASKKDHPGLRRESVCDIDVVILEQSEDFFA